MLQLSAPPPSNPTGYDATLARWARFFAAREDADYERLATEDPMMQLAKDTLDLLSQDPETRRLARERADSLRFYEMELAASKAEGEVRGQAKLLLKQLGVRFGPPSAVTRARVESASLEQLDVWAERVLTAATLDDVLD